MKLSSLPAAARLRSLALPESRWFRELQLWRPAADDALTTGAVETAVVLLSGQNHQAKFELSIPDVPALVGTQFFHQALVLDPAAGNGFGAVVSDVARGIVGEP